MMQAYTCLRCPEQPFEYQPAYCPACDLPMVPLGGVA